MQDLKSVYGRKIDRLEHDVKIKSAQTKKVFKKVRSTAIHCLQNLDRKQYSQGSNKCELIVDTISEYLGDLKECACEMRKVQSPPAQKAATDVLI